MRSLNISVTLYFFAPEFFLSYFIAPISIISPSPGKPVVSKSNTIILFKIFCESIFLALTFLFDRADVFILSPNLDNYSDCILAQKCRKYFNNAYTFVFRIHNYYQQQN